MEVIYVLCEAATEVKASVQRIKCELNGIRMACVYVRRKCVNGGCF